MSFEYYDEEDIAEETDIDDFEHSESDEDENEPEYEYDENSLDGGRKRSSSLREARDKHQKIKDAKDAYKRHQKIKDGKNAANNMPKSGAPTGTPAGGMGATGATGTTTGGASAAGGSTATAGGAAAVGGGAAAGGTAAASGAAAAGGGAAAAGGAAGGAAVAASPVGWVIIAIIAVIVIVLLILILFGIMTNVGEAQASVAEKGLPSNITEEQRQDYKVNYEKKTYTPLSDTDHSYNDEFDLRIPWAVIAEVNSRVYNGEATNEEINEIFNELKPEYKKARYDKDIYKTTIVTTHTGTDVNGKSYTYTTTTTSVVEKKRHIIEEAQTWEGTVKRQYRKEYSSNTYAEGNKTITEEQWVWVYDPTTDKTYEKFREFVQDKLKEKGITVLDSEVSLMVELIELMIQQDEEFTDGESSPDWINKYSSNLVFVGGDFGWPVDSTDVTCCFGDRHRHWDTGAVTLHNGVDISAPMGTPIHAPKEGKVIFAAYSGMGGNTIIVDHGKDSSGKQIITEYCHLSEYKSSVGQDVKKGDVIGLVGSTGSSTGPHLHFIMKVNGDVQDPGVFFYIQVKGNSCKDRGCSNGGKYPGNNYGEYIPTPVGTATSTNLQNGSSSIVQLNSVYARYNSSQEALAHPYFDNNSSREPTPDMVIKELTMETTAYGPFEDEGGVTTAYNFGDGTGWVKPGVCALDKSFRDSLNMPYGTLLYVQGYGYAVIMDCGIGAGYPVLDLGFATKAQEDNWGRQKVSVKVIKSEYLK